MTKLPASEPVRYLSPPEYARRLGVKPSKVIAWIRSGELRSLDASSRPGVGRPRFRISPDAIVEFENRRGVQPAPAPRRRRNKQRNGVVQYF
jgi:hypothetical protein